MIKYFIEKLANIKIMNTSPLKQDLSITRHEMYKKLYQYEQLMNNNRAQQKELLTQGIKYFKQNINLADFKKMTSYRETVITSVHYSGRQTNCLNSAIKALYENNFKVAFHEFVDMIDDYNNQEPIDWNDILLATIFIETFENLMIEDK